MSKRNIILGQWFSKPFMIGLQYGEQFSEKNLPDTIESYYDALSDKGFIILGKDNKVAHKELCLARKSIFHDRFDKLPEYDLTLENNSISFQEFDSSNIWNYSKTHVVNYNSNIKLNDVDNVKVSVDIYFSLLKEFCPSLCLLQKNNNSFSKL